jgi:hypothetical protein
MLHKTRDLMVRQRTALINAVRGHLGEYGITAANGAARVRTILKAIFLEDDQLLVSRAWRCLVWQGSLKRSSGRSKGWRRGSSPGIVGTRQVAA